MRSRWCVVKIVPVVFLVSLLAACAGGDGHPIAKTQGKVLYQGQPVADVVVDFVPQGDGGASPGKSATGRTDASGVFVLSTHEMGDGAVVGKHRVTVGSENPDQPLPGKVPADLILEVKPGSNDFTIELVP